MECSVSQLSDAARAGWAFVQARRPIIGTLAVSPRRPRRFDVSPPRRDLACALADSSGGIADDNQQSCRENVAGAKALDAEAARRRRAHAARPRRTRGADRAASNGASDCRCRSRASRRRTGVASLPLSALGPISATVGASQPGYRIAESGREALARSAPADLRARFTAGGVTLHAPRASVHLRLLSAAYGKDVVRIGAAPPRAHANRVEYAHAGVREWYANGPLGLEQGFTIQARRSASRR